jgi:hypothetical protein
MKLSQIVSKPGLGIITGDMVPFKPQKRKVAQIDVSKTEEGKLVADIYVYPRR